MSETTNDISYCDVEGLIAPSTSLTLSRSRSLAEAIESQRLSFVRLIECRRRSDEDGKAEEVVVFDAEIERPQRCVYAIRKVERLAIVFAEDDGWYPEVLALRKDFPEVPHLNLRASELPRSLCLYDESWSEVALRWTPARFVERIRHWLAETATGVLHQQDQPLEPVLLGNGLNIILPPDLFLNWTDPEPKSLQIGPAFSGKGCRTFVTNTAPDAGGTSMLAVCIKTDPRQRTAINRQPRNLLELDELLASAGCNLREKLSHTLDTVADKDRWNRRLLIVVGFPLIRNAKETVEITDAWAFLTPKSVAEVGIAIGLWIKMPGGDTLGLAISGLSEADEAAVPIEVISPQFGLSRESSAVASGVEPDPRKTIAIGAGALGSQVTQLLAKSGFGDWTIIDSDHLAPHNVARHGLSPTWIGWPKARAMAIELSSVYDTGPNPKFYEGEFVQESTHNADFQGCVDSADLILDMSASVPVARHLANEVQASARRGSIFLNPSGNDLVMLFEDEDRQLTLDCIEMQYYRALAFEEGYEDHLKRPVGRVRYARSCRDVSSSIPTNLVSLHAAIAASEVRSRIESPSASACLWRTDLSPMNVAAFSMELSPVECQRIGDWTLIVSHHIVERLQRQRSCKLPNETGGVLVGSYDLHRKILYVVETIPSPPDSSEWPTLYIRGSKGLATEVERVGRVTDGQLEYVGEWHSHPDGCRCRPSQDDVKVFAWLTENMSDVGLPSLMAIAGQRHTEWYVGEMLESGGWETANRE